MCRTPSHYIVFYYNTVSTPKNDTHVVQTFWKFYLTIISLIKFTDLIIGSSQFMATPHMVLSSHTSRVNTLGEFGLPFLQH